MEDAINTAVENPVVTNDVTTPAALATELQQDSTSQVHVAVEPPLKKIKLEDDSEDQFADAATSSSDVLENTPFVVSETTPNTSTRESVIDTAPIKTEEVSVEQTQMIPDIEISTQSAPVHDEEEDLFGGDEDVDKNRVVETGSEQEHPKETKDIRISIISMSEPTESNQPPTAEDSTRSVVEEASNQTLSAEKIEQLETSNLPSVAEDSIQHAVEEPQKPELTIPRKSNSKHNVSTKNNNTTPGTRYGLPPGVNVPFSIVQSKLLEAEMNTPGSKLMDVLKSLPVNLINDALTEYDDAVEIKGSNSIRNHGAYLYGVVKRYVAVRDRFLNGDTSGTNPMGEDGLTSAVQVRLDQLVTSGFCSSQEMNEKVKSKIRMLSEKDAMFALDELSSVDRSQIRNFGSYFMGILNRYMRGGDPSSKNRPSAPNHHHAGGNNGPSNRHHHPSNNNQNRDRDRFSPPSNTSYSNQSSSSSYRNQSNPRNNRFDNNRGPSNVGQQQRPPFRMGDNSFINDRNPPAQQQPQQQGTHMVPSWQKQQQPPQNQYMGGGSNMPSTMVPAMGGNIQGGPGMPQTNFNYPGQQPPPQYPLQQASPYIHPQTYGQPTSYAQNGTVMYQQQQPNMQMMQPYMGNQMPAQQQPPPMMNQSSQFVQSNPLSQGPASIDILGLADKAASAIQALGANKINQPLGQGYSTPQMSVQPQQSGYQLPYGGPAHMMGQQPNMSMTHQPQPPRPTQPGFPVHQMYPSAPQQQPHQQSYAGPSVQPVMNQHSQPTQSHQNQQGSRRRTTASISELPINVQYALQNLIATGALDGQPDDGILGMILDLPEPAALTGLQKFAAVDKSTMRNKFAYLAGVLRRELEGIQRR